jgi:hypothetical protein
MFDKLVKAGKSVLCSVKKFGNEVKDKALALIGVGATTVATVQSQAAVTFDSATKQFSGDMDMTAYYSATEIAIGVIAITLAIALGIKMLRKSA